MKENKKVRKIFELPISFFLMIVSCGVLGGFLLNLHFSIIFALIMIPLVFSSYISLHWFFSLLSKLERASNQIVDSQKSN